MTDRLVERPSATTLDDDTAAELPVRPADRPPAAPPRRPEPAPGAPPGWTRRQRYVLGAIAAFLFLAYTTYACARHAKYETTGFDLGIFDQVVRAYAHFHAPTSPLKGIGYDILGDHFHPILVLLVPLYWIWDDPRMLLAAQAVLLAVSVVPVAAFVRRRFGAVAALLLAFAYGASWPLEEAVHFDFHEIAFAVPLLAWLIDAMDRRAHRTVVLCCLALLLVREDMGAVVVVVGLLVGLRGVRAATTRHGRRVALALGGGLAVTGLAGYWLATSVIIPAFAPFGFTYWTFPALGPDPVSALNTIFRHPFRVARLMVTPAVKFHTLTTLFYPTGFLGLFSPYVLLTAPFLAERMLNDRRFLWETNFHYNSVSAPIIMLAAVDTVSRLARRFPALAGRRRVRGVWLGLPAAFVAWTVGVVAYQLVVDGSDYPVRNLTGRVWTRDARWHAVHDMIPLIPPGQCVEAYNQMAPQLTGRDYVTRVTFSGGLATYVVIDTSPDQKDTGWQSPAPAEALRISRSNGYTIVARKGPVILLHKDRPVAPVCRGLY